MSSDNEQQTDQKKYDEKDQEEDSGVFSKVIPDLFKRALTTGIGSVFMTEESIRSTLTDMKMPKEAMQYVISQANGTKKELVSTIARELRSFLDDLQIEELIAKGFEDKTFEIHTTIRVKSDAKKTAQVEVVDNNISVSDDSEKKAVKKKAKARTKRVVKKKVNVK